MFKKIQEIDNRYRELESMLSDPAVVANRGEFQRLAKEYSDLRDLLETYREYEQVCSQIEEDQKLLREESDEEMKGAPEGGNSPA